MTFGEAVNDYIARIGCTARELAQASGLSPAALSRYRSGEREPDADAPELDKLAAGIAALGAERIPGLTAEAAAGGLRAALRIEQPLDRPIANLNALLSVLGVNLSRLARGISYDPSHLYRIRAGQRRPADPQGFLDSVCRYLVREYSDPDARRAMARLIGCSADELRTDAVCRERLLDWLLDGARPTEDDIGRFLHKVDEFDLDEYVRAIHFDELKAPTAPFQLHGSRQYVGLEQMKDGELAFFKTTVLSRSNEPIFMCSDMPMDDLGADVEFAKKWMFAIAVCLKKGLHLNIIHNVDRPFHEMMLGLEGWIPLYMTGQVSPYHLRSGAGGVYRHLTYVSGAAALDGQCIVGHHAEGKYDFTSSRSELAYYRRRAEHLLSLAQPLMEIYRAPDAQRLSAFWDADAAVSGQRCSILSSLPIFTMSAELMDAVLTRAGTPEEERRRLHDYRLMMLRQTERILENGTLNEQTPVSGREEFDRYPASLQLAGAFCTQELRYTYDEYRAHLAQTQAFADAHPTYTLRTDGTHAFRNTDILIHKGKWAIISKGKAPTVHFVVRHPKLLSAIENFVPPILE